MNQTPIRIAFSAMGDHATRAHLKHFVPTDKCQVVGGFDPGVQLEGNQQWLSENGLDDSFKQYKSFDDLVTDPNVDAVLIASPDKFHLQQLQQAVNAGKHVFCEKPLCDDPKDLPRLKQILETAEAKGLKVSSCHPRRFDPPYVWLKENLEDLTEKYGKVLSINLDFSYHEPSAEKHGLHGGSLLLDHANHEIDYVNFLLGRSGTDMTKLTDSADHYALAGTRDDGVIINFHGTRRLSESIYPETIKVRFERGELDMNTYDSSLSRIIDHEKIIHQTGEHQAPTESVIPVNHPVTDYDHRFNNINHDWLDSIAQNKQGYLTNEEMLFNSAASVGFSKKGTNTLRIEATPDLTRSRINYCDPAKMAK